MGEAGFTLVEMLASLVLLAAISWMLISGPLVARTAWRRLEDRAQASESVAGAQAMLRARLRAIYPATRYAGGEAMIALAGAADRLDFLAPPPSQAGPAPLVRYHLALDGRDELTLSGVSDVAGTGAVAKTAVLARGVEGLEISYFGPQADDPQGPGAWQTRWIDRPAPPELIRIRLAFRPGDRRRWPDLIVHPAANVDADCILSPQTGRCRGRA